MEKKQQGYYDIETTEFLDLGDILYLKDLRQRKLYFNSEITTSLVSDAVQHILQFNTEDYGIPPEKRKPILFYLTSPGGEVDSGFALIDAITNSKTPVYTINLGYQYSMGFLVGLAGHKRFAMPNAKFLMHDGSNFVFNSGAKAQDQMEFQKKVEDRIKKHVLSRSKITEEEYDSKLRVEWYMFADEAKTRGCIDYIIGEDCDLDTIIKSESGVGV